MKLFTVITLFTILYVQGVLGEEKFILLHVSDIYARYDESSPQGGTCYGHIKQQKLCVGGVARIKHKVNDFREKAKEGEIPPVLFLLNGNVMTGTAWDILYKWDVAVAVINDLKPDAMSLGMTEFDEGPTELLKAFEKIQVPIIATNVDFSRLESRTKSTKYHIIKIKNIKIGIIGVAVKVRERSNSDEVLIADEVDSVISQCNLLKTDDVHMIIVMSSCGIKIDQKIASIPDVDLVLSGLDKPFLYSGHPPAEEMPQFPYPFFVVQDNGKRVPIVKAYAYAKYLGYLEVTFDSSGRITDATGNPIYLSNSVSQDPTMNVALDRFRRAATIYSTQKLGKSVVILQGFDEVCGIKECNTGNMLTDAFVSFATGVDFPGEWSTTPIAVTHAGSIKMQLDMRKQESINQGDLATIIPYQYKLSVITVKGSDIKSLLENSVSSGIDKARTEFLQVSGIRVAYDMSKSQGNRVLSVKLRCGKCPIPKYENLDESRVYNVVLPKYIVDGHGGFSHVMNDIKIQHTVDLSQEDLGVTSWYIQKESPIHPEIQDRISFAGAGKKVKSMESGTVSTLNKKMGTYSFGSVLIVYFSVCVII